MRDLNEILAEVRGKIAAACARTGRDPAEVEIVAVTKTHGAEVVKEAWDAGLTIVGENKVQEAAWKKPASVTGPSWHLIGHLQGMSGDYEVAVEEGATWLRLGTALFGERPKVKAVRAAADDPPPHQGSAGRSAVRPERTAPLPCGARPARPQRDSPRPRGGQVGRLRPFQRLDARLSGIWTRPFARVHRVRQRLRLRRAAAGPTSRSFWTSSQPRRRRVCADARRRRTRRPTALSARATDSTRGCARNAAHRR